MLGRHIANYNIGLQDTVLAQLLYHLNTAHTYIAYISHIGTMPVHHLQMMGRRRTNYLRTRQHYLFLLLLLMDNSVHSSIGVLYAVWVTCAAQGGKLKVLVLYNVVINVTQRKQGLQLKCNTVPQWVKNLSVYSLVRQRRKVGRFGAETTSNGRLFHMGMVSGKKRKFIDIIRWAERNIPPRVERTCLSCGHGQPSLPGVPCRCTRYAIHHLEPHVVLAGSKGLPVEVVNHLAYSARVVKTVASVSCSPSLNHFQFVYIFSCMWAPDRGGIFQMRLY